MSANKYLDSAGVSYLWSKIKAADSELADSVAGKAGFIDYDSKSKNIRLWATSADVNAEDKEPLATIDATAFLADGMLNDVTIVEASVDSPIIVEDEGNTSYTEGTFIKFTWTLADGSDKVEYLNAQKIGKIYSGSDTIDINEQNQIEVKKVEATKTMTSGAIQIAGGPLANNVAESEEVWPADWKDESGNKIIPDGKSLQEILTALFLKVIDGTVKWGSASWSPSLAKPTVTLSSNGPVEVGSKVKVSALTAGTATAGTRSVTCTCSQGHYLADAEGNPTGSHISGNKTISVNASVDGTATLACTWNNVATDITVNSTELTVVEGTNTIKASQSGQTATCEALPTTKVFAATNTKSLLSDVSATFSENKPADKPLTSENTDTINAYYPIYTNGKQGTANAQSNETTLVANDGTKLNLVADNTTFYVLFAPMIDGGTGYRLLVKSGKTITQAMALNTLNGNYEVDMKDLFVKAAGTVKKLSGDVEVDYDVYEAKGSSGANAVQIKID